MSISFDLTIDDTRDQLARHARASLEAKPSLIGMSREEMAEALIKAGVPERQVKMRISQLWHWLYVRGVSDFADMRNISKDLRATLAKHFTIARPEIVEEQVSNDGTRKWLFRFPPRGRDILAACGQLKSESERLKKHERLALEAMMIAGHGE